MHQIDLQLYLLCYHDFCNIKTADLHPEKVWSAITTTGMDKSMSIYSTMITIFLKDCNSISQSEYDSIINSIQLHQLSCSCGHSGCMSIHGYYHRSVKLPDGMIRLRICRVKCSECNKTHALLLSSLVPYSQIRLSDQHQICVDFENAACVLSVCESNIEIDENNVKYILRNYRRCWREMLRSIRVLLNPVADLISACFSNYSSQFMQIHRGCNLFFLSTT